MKRAQAAMEFLMTYGWAILVVLVAIGALAYFGVLNPAKFLPESCTLAPGFACVDKQILSSGNQINLVVQNGLGEDLTDVTIQMAGGDCTGNSTAIPLNDGEQETFTINCAETLTSGSRFKETVTLTYTGDSGLNHSKSGEIIGKVE